MMFHMRKGCCVLGVLVALVGVLQLPANAYVDDDLQSWTIVTLQGNITDKVQGYFEVQPRIGNDITKIDRLLVRPAVGYQLTKKFSLWQGMAWTPTFQPEYNNEIRLFQQGLLENHFKDLTLINRTRMEERFIDNAGETAYRARHMARVTYPLGQKKRWYLVGYDEIFFNLNSVPNAKGPKSGFDQNRLFVGIGRKITEHLRIEGGYMANFVNRPAPTADRLNHIILVGISAFL